MSRAQDGPQGRQAGAQVPQETTGVPGTGTTTGAVATGNTGTTTTSTTSGPPEQSMQQSGTQQPGAHRQTSARGTATTTEYRGADYGYADQGGGSFAGGSFAILAGLVTFLAGLSAVVRRNFYHVATNYAYNIHAYDWGWILLGLGMALFAVGACALLGMTWARYLGVGVAVLTTIAGFLFLPYTPVWGIVIVGVSVFAIWGLLHDGESRARA